MAFQEAGGFPGLDSGMVAASNRKDGGRELASQGEAFWAALEAVVRNQSVLEPHFVRPASLNPVPSVLPMRQVTCFLPAP